MLRMIKIVQMASGMANSVVGLRIAIVFKITFFNSLGTWLMEFLSSVIYVGKSSASDGLRVTAASRMKL